MSLDDILRIIVIVFACIFIIKYASLYEEEYNKNLIDLYIQPWWRVLLILLVIAAAMWSPTVSIVIAFLAFFYLSDMNTLITPFAN